MKTLFSIRLPDEQDVRAKEILTQLEEQLGERTWSTGAAGDRHLILLVDAGDGLRMLEQNLDRIDPNWSNHLTVRPPAGA